MITSALVLAAVLAAVPQQTDSLGLRGTVRSADGAPIEGANVFLLETLEGALTSADGRFLVRTPRTGAATIVVRRIGFRAAQLSVTLPAPPLAVVLATEAATLSVV